MRLRRLVMTVMGGLAVTLATGLPAIAKNQQRVKLFNEESLGATTLSEGEYLVKWQTHSPEATVTFVMNKKVVAELKGRIVEHEKKVDRNMVVDGPGPDGTRVLMEIWLAGTNKSIVFTP
jgi:hypothetical protein